MLIFLIAIFVLYYILFYKEILNTKHILLLIFIIKVIFILQYFYTDNYNGLTDDYNYWAIGRALLTYSPLELLFSNAISYLFMLSGGVHVIYNFLNYYVYYYFGDNIMNMLLFNLVVFVLCFYLLKKIGEQIFSSYHDQLILCFIFLLYPDLWAYGFFNLKDFVAMFLVLLQIYSTFRFRLADKIPTKIIWLCILLTGLLLILFLRFYAVGLYILAVVSWYVFVKKNYSIAKFQLGVLFLLLIRVKGFYDFSISPFFLTVSPAYAFMRIPSLIQWMLLYPIVIMGIIQVIKDNNEKFKLILFYLNYTFLFYSYLGYGKGIAGPRQRIFIEFIYVFLIVFGLKFLDSHTNIFKKTRSWLYGEL